MLPTQSPEVGVEAGSVVVPRPDDWREYVDLGDEVEGLKTRRKQVAFVLNRFPDTRNSDKRLWLKYLEVVFGLNPEDTALSIAGDAEIPAQTSVARARADLQNRYRLYLPTRPEVILQRQKLRRAYSGAFLWFDDAEEGEETLVYSDESGTTSRYMVIAFVLFLSSRDLFEFTGKVANWGGRRSYFHFKDVRPDRLAEYGEFVAFAFGRPSIRAHVHVFDSSKMLGPKAEILADSYEVACLATVRHLQASGAIDVGRRVRLLPDSGQDQLLYRRVENRLDGQLKERKLDLVGVEATSSRDAYAIQVADLLASSVGRRLNSPGAGVKDDLATLVLRHAGIGASLDSTTGRNIVVSDYANAS